MSDQHSVLDGSDALVQPHEDLISDVQARTLASIWRDYRDDEGPLSLLADSGEITRATAPAIRRDLLQLQHAASTESEQASPVTAQSQLAALLSYCVEHGPRGPVDGWHQLPTLDPQENSMLPWTEEHVLANGTQPSANGYHPTPPPAASEHGHRATVFDLIGGARAVEDLVETFYDMMMADPELAPYFRGFSVAKIKQHQHMFLTAVTGGPNIYVGRPLRVAHMALRISGPHFDRTSEHLDATLTVKGVDPDHRAVILARVNALRRHIISG